MTAQRGWAGSIRGRPEGALLSLAVLIVAADVLFFDRAVGISLAIFLGLLALGAVLADREASARRERILGGLVLLAALAPLAETVSFITVGFAVTGTALGVLVATGKARHGWQETMRRVALLTIAHPPSLRRAAVTAMAREGRAPIARLRRLAASWAIPTALGLGFVALFSLANPIFRSTIALLNIAQLLDLLDPFRIGLWALAAAFAIAFLKSDFSPPPAPSAISGAPAEGRVGPRLTPATVARCLVVFNAVFALETGIDLTHLWAGRWTGAPPVGVSHAGHAQEAAYLLVFTALLSAAFVLLAIRDREGSRPSRMVRAMMHLWIAQNILLVFSAILRLDIYVDAYSLTRLRFAAFVWMGLVAFGLATILVRVALERSNRWLVRTNLAAVFLAIYACGVADVNKAIADYNVAHAQEIDGSGMPLDPTYLCSLGPSALPAIHRFIESRQYGLQSAGWHRLQGCVGRIERRLAQTAGDWRAFTFRQHRLRSAISNLYNPANAAGPKLDTTPHGPHDPRR